MSVTSAAKAPPDVSAVVVTWNSSGYVDQCVGGLVGKAREVIVVDNASHDGTPELVKETFPDVRVIGLSENRGYGGANNIGIDAAVGGYVLLVNPDAWPVGDAIEQLVGFADRRPRAGIVGPTLVFPDGSPQRSVFGYPHHAISLATWAVFPASVARVYSSWQEARRWARGVAVKKSESDIVLSDKEFVLGAVLLLRREAVAEVGGFDERFFMFSEETDLCYRMQDAGWSVEVDPHATFVHVGGGDIAADPDRFSAELLVSCLRLLSKRGSRARAGRARKTLLFALAARALVARGSQKHRLRRSIDRLRSLSIHDLR